jgi:hypothetical protein
MFLDTLPMKQLLMKPLSINISSDNNPVNAFIAPGLSGKLSKAFTIGLFSFFLLSFNHISTVDEIVAAMRAGDAAQLSKHFDQRVNLTLSAKDEIYSKSQAEMIMKDFFASNPVRAFKLKHKGESKDGSQYFIGSLSTKSREFRTSFYLKQKTDDLVIHTITFQEE